MELSMTLLIVCAVCLLILLALCLKGDVKAMFKFAFLTFSLEAKDKKRKAR